MKQEAAAEAGSKRKAEEEPAAGEAEGAPPAKEPKTEAEVKEAPAAEADDAGEAGAGEGEAAAAAAGGEQAAPQEPVEIGYKTFASGEAALAYYRSLISKLRKYQNLNDYEFHMVHDLVKKGHPDATRKLEGGVRSIQIREVDIGGNVTACFFLVHEDGSDEDVSYRKCLASLFPPLAKQMESTGGARKSSGRGGSGGGRGGGRGGRSPGGRGGRGGRGGGRGRGRGRH